MVTNQCVVEDVDPIYKITLHVPTKKDLFKIVQTILEKCFLVTDGKVYIYIIKSLALKRVKLNNQPVLELSNTAVQYSVEYFQKTGKEEILKNLKIDPKVREIEVIQKLNPYPPEKNKSFYNLHKTIL